MHSLISVPPSGQVNACLSKTDGLPQGLLRTSSSFAPLGDANCGVPSDKLLPCKPSGDMPLGDFVAGVAANRLLASGEPLTSCIASFGAAPSAIDEECNCA